VSVRVALGHQLSDCPSVVTIGVRANLSDYTGWETDLIHQSVKIYFPTVLYADAFGAMGKETFPSVHSYRHLGDKIKQTHLFQFQGVPMPRTRLYYGRRQREKILDDFAFPFIGKIPRGSSRGEGVFMIRDPEDLHSYLPKTPVAYIQQYIPMERDLRVIVVGKRFVHAYWKEAAPGEFRTNLARGGRPRLDPIPDEAVKLALEVAGQCGFDHVGLDICQHQGRFLIIEANMVFGTAGFRVAGLNYKEILKAMVNSGEI
jgi:ribosomal protein S6--L-glutamate ligase